VFHALVVVMVAMDMAFARSKSQAPLADGRLMCRDI
jgi:hypothetical protein